MRRRFAPGNAPDQGANVIDRFASYVGAGLARGRRPELDDDRDAAYDAQDAVTTHRDRVNAYRCETEFSDFSVFRLFRRVKKEARGLLEPQGGRALYPATVARHQQRIDVADRLRNLLEQVFRVPGFSADCKKAPHHFEA